MAIFRMEIQSLDRKEGRRATSAAAYRAGERIRDERSGELFNHSRRQDVVHKEIFLPSKVDGPAVDWARDRSKLWNAAERAETRRTARVAREFEVALPSELNAEGRLALARTFSREVAERYNVAVDLAVHDPRAGSDPRNFHAHLLMTTREVTPDGLGAKSGMDMPVRQRQQRGLPTVREEFVNIRERWAALANEALKEANVEARIDHRSLAAQGVDREPRPRLPTAVYKLERKGVATDVGKRLREDYEARVQERLQRAAERQVAPSQPSETHSGQPRAAHSQPMQSQPSQPRPGQSRAAQSQPTPTQSAQSRAADSPPPHPEPQLPPTRDLAEIQRRAREAWLRLRQAELQKSSTHEAQKLPTHQAGKEADKANNKASDKAAAQSPQQTRDDATPSRSTQRTDDYSL